MKQPVLTPETLYRHPDGWAIQYSENALIATDDEDNLVTIPIGRHYLLELSRKLYDIAQSMDDTE